MFLFVLLLLLSLGSRLTLGGRLPMRLLHLSLHLGLRWPLHLLLQLRLPLRLHWLRMWLPLHLFGLPNRLPLCLGSPGRRRLPVHLGLRLHGRLLHRLWPGRCLPLRLRCERRRLVLWL